MYTSPTLTNANIKSVIINTTITVKRFCCWTKEICLISMDAF